MGQIVSSPVSSLRGSYSPPGDKSISHRLAMLGAIADGVSVFDHFLYSEDCVRTIEAFRAMGVAFKLEAGRLVVHGVGMHGLSAPKRELDLGNSGTTMRLLMGMLAGQRFRTRLTGDKFLKKRPMRRVTVPLMKMGAQITGPDEGNFAPIEIMGRSLKGIEWVNEVPSAQVKSAVLLAGLFAEGPTSVREPNPSRDHTERLLPEFGVSLETSEDMVRVTRPKRLRPIKFEVPGDISSAAYYVVAAAMTPGADVWIRNVGLNPTRTGILDVLQQMGADISVHQKKHKVEPVGDLHVKGNRLGSVNIEGSQVPRLVDELPILMVACALAEGKSVISGAEELRVKETDRIRAMVMGLQAIGCRVEETPDGCVIHGTDHFEGGEVRSCGDHRTAMSFAVAGLGSKKGVIVQDTACIGTSYPGFEADWQRFLGGGGQ